jgi:hypothetical protein
VAQWGGAAKGPRKRPTHVAAAAERAIERGPPGAVAAVLVDPIRGGAIRVIARAADVVSVSSVSPLGHFYVGDCPRSGRAALTTHAALSTAAAAS